MGDEKDEGLKPLIDWYREISGAINAELEKRGMPLGAVPAIIKAGHIFVLTSGEYSDYRLDGVFRALEDIDPEDLCAAAIEQEEDLAAKLVREGFAEELTFTEWHRD